MEVAPGCKGLSQVIKYANYGLKLCVVMWKSFKEVSQLDGTFFFEERI